MPHRNPLLDGPTQARLERLDALVTTWSGHATTFRALQQQWMGLQEDFEDASDLDYSEVAARMLETGDVDARLAEVDATRRARAVRAAQVAQRERALEAESQSVEKAISHVEDAIHAQLTALASTPTDLLLDRITTTLCAEGVDTEEARELAAILAGEPDALQRQQLAMTAALQLQSALVDQMRQTQQEIASKLDEPAPWPEE